MKEPHDLLSRLKQIRELDHRSQEDCAAALGVSIHDYISKEDGTGMLELSDLELLAFFFKIPVSLFFDDCTFDKFVFPVIENQLQQQYRNLRRKLLSVTLLHELHEQNLSLLDLQQKTQIPFENLKAFTTGKSTIPIHHLIELSQALSLPIEDLTSLNANQPVDTDSKTKPTEWELEYPQVPNEDPEEDN